METFMSEKPSRLGEIIRREREKRGLTQADLATQLEVDVRSLRSWEKGTHIPTLYTRQKLSQLFGTSPEELGFISTEEQRSSSSHLSTTQDIEFTIQEGDITTFEA